MPNPIGRPRCIESPEKMWELFQGYLNLINANPILVEDFVGKDGDRVLRQKTRPLTMEGFRAYGYDNQVTIKHYFDNQDNAYEDFCTICSRIKDIIRANQIEGGMVGIFNPSITQRLNGLKEHQETEIKGTLNIPNLPDIGDRK